MAWKLLALVIIAPAVIWADLAIPVVFAREVVRASAGLAFSIFSRGSNP